MFAKRVTTALVGIPLLFAVLLSGNRLVVSTAVAIVSFIGLFELYTAFGYVRQKGLVVLGGLAVLGICYAQFLNTALIMPLIFAYVFLLSLAAVLYHQSVHFSDIAAVFFFTFYIPFFLNHVVLVWSMERGVLLVWLIFGGAWLCDTFAYFVGKAWGRHPLCPRVSPKKTVEGAVGGLAGTCVSFLLYGGVLAYFFSIRVDFIRLFILALLCGVSAIVGDLMASVMKRERELKDFGQVMPGHGGVLDRFDSLLFVAPLVYGFLLWFPVF